MLKSTAITLSVLFIVFAYTANILWRRSFFYDGILAIAKLQAQWESPLMTKIQNIITKTFGSTTMLFVMFVVYLAMKRKITVIVFIIFIHMKSYVIYVTKLAFMDPRPFWSTTHVKQLEWGCPDQYGNPSGHSSSIFFYAMILNDIIFRNQRPLPWIIAALVGFTVPISRLYLGAHSSNQVVLGMILEMGFLVLYRYKLHIVIYNGLNNLITRKNTGQLILILVSYALFLLVPLVVYQLRIPHPTDQPFIGNMLIGCPKSQTRTGLAMLTKTFEGCGFISIVFGIVLAIWLSDIGNYKYLYGRWRYTYHVSGGFLLRIIIEAVPTLAVNWFFAMTVPKMFPNAYLRYLSSSIGSFLVGFVTVFLSRRILLGCQVVQEIQPITASVPLAVQNSPTV